MKILFTGGGTGGHVFPLVAIAREIRRIYPKKDLEFHYLGPQDELANIYLSEEDFIIHTIMSGKIRRYFSFENILDIGFKIPFGILQSIFMMMRLKPDLVFSKGGSGSFSVTYAAKILKIPVFLHESDIVPGLSNQKTSKWAKKIFISFEDTEYFDKKTTTLTGNPIRHELLEGDKQTAKDLFNLTLEKPIFLFIGGSQGAGPINDFVLNVLEKLVKEYEVIHVTGQENFNQVQAESEVVIDKALEKFYHPIAFLNEEKMKHAYKAADLIISRSGASSIFEIAALGKPSVLVPLPTAAGDHQSKNAYSYARGGAALVIEQDNLTPNFFMENIEILFLNPEKIEAMKQAALSFAKPLAARSIAREVLEFLMLD